MARPTSLGGLGKREKTLEVERSRHGQSHVSLGSGVAEPAGGGGAGDGVWRERQAAVPQGLSEGCGLGEGRW